jgi:hypothetical protein
VALFDKQLYIRILNFCIHVPLISFLFSIFGLLIFFFLSDERIGGFFGRTQRSKDGTTTGTTKKNIYMDHNFFWLLRELTKLFANKKCVEIPQFGAPLFKATKLIYFIFLFYFFVLFSGASFFKQNLFFLYSEFRIK